MRFNNKVRNDGWKMSFAFLPVEIGDTWIWWEPYWSRFEGLYTNVRLIDENPFK